MHCFPLCIRCCINAKFFRSCLVSKAEQKLTFKGPRLLLLVELRGVVGGGGADRGLPAGLPGQAEPPLARGHVGVPEPKK